MIHHGTSDSSHYGPSRRRSWEWWLLCGLALIAAWAGFAGMRAYELENHGHADLRSVGYHTLQLFILHAPHLEYAVPSTLHLGRWLAAVVVLTALAKALIKIFQAECRLFWARCRSGHVVICGLGKLGLQLAREFRRAGKRVVAIDAERSAEHIASAQQWGVAVLVGDACDPAELRRAGLSRAEQVIAVCDDEQTNVAVAAVVGALLAESASRKKPVSRKKPHTLESWIFIPDARLRRLFQQGNLFPNTNSNYRVNVRGLNVFEIASRQALTRHPLDFERIRADDSTVVHLVIVGFGSMGQHLALQAVRIGHFANFKKLRLTVVERKGSRRPNDFVKCYPQINDICTFETTEIAGDVADVCSLLATVVPKSAQDKELTTFAFCWDSAAEGLTSESDLFHQLEQDDATNLSMALDLTQEQQAKHAQILVFQTRKCGFGALFPEAPPTGRGSAIANTLHAFGMLEEICSLDTLMHERDDIIAKAIHQDYYENQINEGKKRGSKSALFEWGALEERYKNSNRNAADHIPVKLRAIGYRVAPLQYDQENHRLTALDDLDHTDPDGNVDLFARMEHERWCAQERLQNIKEGKRDDAAGTHDCLIPWKDLPEGTKEWDRQQVRAIPKALERAGSGIYPEDRDSSGRSR